MPLRYLRVRTAAGHLVLTRNWEWGTSELEVNQVPKDRTGNVFLKYNPGRYDGVIVLRGAGGRIEDFGTLPAGGDDYEGSGPFGYWTETVPSRTRPGIVDIEQHGYDETGADSTYQRLATEQYYEWTGHGYGLRATYKYDGRRMVRQPTSCGPATTPSAAA